MFKAGAPIKLELDKLEESESIGWEDFNTRMFTL